MDLPLPLAGEVATRSGAGEGVAEHSDLSHKERQWSLRRNRLDPTALRGHLAVVVLPGAGAV